MKKRTTVVALSIFALLVAAAFTGCAPKAAEAPVKPAVEVKTIRVATQNDYPPFCYKDDKGTLTGYDIEVVQEINKKLEGYKFVFQDSSWDSIFPSLESNKVQIVADEIAKNPEREQKYLFSDVSYFSAQSVILVKKGRTDIKTLKDLEGKNVAASPGDSYTQLLEKYNSENGNKIHLKYTDAGADPSAILQDIQSGRVDAYVNDPVMAAAAIKKLNLNVEIAGEPIQSDNINLVFQKNKGGEELKAKIDPIIQQLKADGTLKKLSQKWTGGEYIPQ